MTGNKKHDFTIFQSIIIMVVLYAIIALLGAIFGVFYTSMIWSVWILLCLLFYKKKIISFPVPSSALTSYMLIALSFSLLIAYFTVPTIFSGRDQGSIAGAAIQLAASHSLITYSPESTAFFEIYGRGKALNFPGFFYTPDGGLLTQFPLPYISYLAGFFGLFGTTGLVAANSILLFVFILSITFIAQIYMNKKHVFIFLALLLSSFAIGWFAKFTLSENYANAILWSTLALFIILGRNPRPITFFTFLTSLSLLLFSRLEGVWFFAIFAFLTLYNKDIRDFIRQDLWWRAIFPLVTLFTIGSTVIIMNLPFVYTMAHVFVKNTSGGNPSSMLAEITHLFSIYNTYGLLIPLLATLVMVVIAFTHKNKRFALIPVIITLPLFSYYLFPQISNDHPWMLRRFVFAVLPTTILVSTFFVASLASHSRPSKIIGYIIVGLLLLTNIPAFATFITYTENPTLQKQVHDFATQFSSNDLILVDKDAAGNGWSMITAPLRSLENKHAVYFFNPADYAKLDTSAFDHVYLVTPHKNKDHYTEELSDNMHYVNKYTFTVDQLELDDNNTSFPQKQSTTIRGTIYELRY